MKMLETPATQYDSFLYWRQPIPELDLSELQDLGVAKVVPIQKNKTKKKKKSPLKPKKGGETTNELSEYNAFQYWREPIVSIDNLDFNLLLWSYTVSTMDRISLVRNKPVSDILNLSVSYK